MQQASGLGRLVLNFANTPMQYARIIKKSTKDLLAGRGDWRTNVSRILYYGAVQNLIFNALQQAIFTLLFDEEEVDEDWLEEELEEEWEDEWLDDDEAESDGSVSDEEEVDEEQVDETEMPLEEENEDDSFLSLTAIEEIISPSIERGCKRVKNIQK